MGWLLDGVDSGRFPDPHITASAMATLSLQIALRHVRTASPAIDCFPLDATTRRRVPRGGFIDFAHGDVAVELRENGVLSKPVVFHHSSGSRLEAIAGPLDLQLSPTGRGDPPELCA